MQKKLWKTLFSLIFNKLILPYYKVFPFIMENVNQFLIWLISAFEDLSEAEDAKVKIKKFI